MVEHSKRLWRCGTAVAVATFAALSLGLAGAASAAEPGVHVDPGSPAGKEYALPLDQARNDQHRNHAQQQPHGKRRGFRLEADEDGGIGDFGETGIGRTNRFTGC